MCIFPTININDHKATVVSVLKKIFESDQYLTRYNIQCKLIYCLNFFYNDDKLVRNNNLLLYNSQVLANISYIEAPGITFVDRFVSNKLKKTPRLLIL